MCESGEERGSRSTRLRTATSGLRDGRRLPTYRGLGCAHSPTAFPPAGSVAGHPIGTSRQPEHFSLAWRDGFASWGGIAACRRVREDDGLAFEQIQTQLGVFLPKESMFVKHVVLVVPGVRGWFQCSPLNQCTSGLCCNVFVLRMNLDSFSGLR